MVERIRNARPRALTARTADPHILYERAVQSIPADLDFAERIFRAHRKKSLRSLREDFCGTAALASSWVRRHPDNRAFGVDLHGPTLDWGLREHVARMTPKEQARLLLLQENVLTAATPPADLTMALNFSYSVFHDRVALRAYFEAVHAGLNSKGLFIVDAFGGTESNIPFVETRRMSAGETVEGDPLPAFTYIWEQAEFNVVDHRLRCHIHFRFRDKSRLRRAYTYDWRFWTLPELREVLLEAGFREVEMYLHGWTRNGESDGVFRARTRSENAESWLAYVVGIR
ncbi:MAG: class I SAM-dependent methyltransferase [Candidatus Eisenbacteria bacterium]|nr:class I SAM-dependent methyltransferase [Candidatus Eisenbacteria bacterium]